MIVRVNKEEEKDDDKSYFLPVSKISCDLKIQDSIAVLKMTQQFENKINEEDDDQKPIEIKYQFPKEDDAVISKMTIKLGEKEINAKVIEAKKAQEKYDDAIAAGNQATLLQEDSKNQEMHQLEVGNVLPGATVTV